MQELITAANTVGLFRSKVFGRRLPEEWTLLVVVAAQQRGEENIVTAEFLDSLTGESTRFNCFSAEALFQLGQFLNMRGDEISVLHPATLIPITFRKGSVIQQHRDDTEPVALQPPPKQPRIFLDGSRLIPANEATNPRTIDVHKTSYAIPKAEIKHFQSSRISMLDFRAALGPVIKTYARAGIRKPDQVSAKLNSDGFKTARGNKWTPRLTGFLLALIFMDHKDVPQLSGPRNNLNGVSKARATGRVSDRKDPFTQGDLIAGLSRLGRVVIKRH